MSAAFGAKLYDVAKGSFAERFANGVVAPWARRTGRLEALVHHLGLALGVDLLRALRGVSCCRSATTCCFVSSVVGVAHRLLRQR
jgi:hypothetical protein